MTEQNPRLPDNPYEAALEIVQREIESGEHVDAIAESMALWGMDVRDDR